MKFWRRGIQDVDYLTLASKINPRKTDSIISEIIPKVLWEYGKGEKSDINDPTWVKHNISWSDDPDVWETARSSLADIIALNQSNLTHGHSVQPLFIKKLYPNPFSHMTTLQFTVKTHESVSIIIYSSHGKVIKTLINNKILAPRLYAMQWFGQSDTNAAVSNGIYFLKIKVGNNLIIKKVGVLK